MLLRGAEDRRIQDFFIEQAFPPRERRRPRAGRSTPTDGATLPALIGARQPRARAGSRRCSRCSTSRARSSATARRWTRAPGTRLALRRRALRARSPRCAGASRRRWRAFGADGRCLMRALQEELDDPDAAGLRALRGLRRRRGSTGRSTRSSCARRRCTCARARSCSRSRRWRPTPRARCASSPTTCAPRRAARSRGSATAAGTRWCSAGRREGRFDDELVDAAAEAGARAGRVAGARGSRAVPSLRSGDARARLRASGSPAALGLPFADVARARRRRPAAARDGQLARSRSPTCAARSRSSPRRRRAPCLLVDDVRFSGWTLAMVAGQLRRKGAGPVYPLALATAF